MLIDIVFTNAPDYHDDAAFKPVIDLSSKIEDAAGLQSLSIAMSRGKNPFYRKTVEGSPDHVRFVLTRIFSACQTTDGCRDWGQAHDAIYNEPVHRFEIDCSKVDFTKLEAA